jgi:hypothetical protein
MAQADRTPVTQFTNGNRVQLDRDYIDRLHPSAIARIALDALRGSVAMSTPPYYNIIWDGAYEWSTMHEDEIELVA